MACPECRDRVDMFREWWLQCRENLGRLQLVKSEQKSLYEQQLQPDTTNNDEGVIEISLTDAAQEERPIEKPNNLITIMKLNEDESEEHNLHTHFGDNIQHCYRHNIQNIPLNLVRNEKQDTMNDVYQSSLFVNTIMKKQFHHHQLQMV